MGFFFRICQLEQTKIKTFNLLELEHKCDHVFVIRPFTIWSHFGLILMFLYNSLITSLFFSSSPSSSSGRYREVAEILDERLEPHRKAVKIVERLTEKSVDEDFFKSCVSWKTVNSLKIDVFTPMLDIKGVSEFRKHQLDIIISLLKLRKGIFH